MIKEAIEYVLGLSKHNAPIQTESVNGQTYTNSKVRQLHVPTINDLEVHNLSGIVEYLQSDFDRKLPVIIHVISPTEVRILTELNGDLKRSTLITATALLPNIKFNTYYDIESFNILLQSCFVPSTDNPLNDREAVLRVVGNVKDESVQTFGDNGISQQVTAKTGVATFENVPVPNPVHLKPFRTFVEIEQPLSSFVLRMKDGPSAALFEADGGAWKVIAIEEIKGYLHSQLSPLIEQDQVVIVG